MAKRKASNKSTNGQTLIEGTFDPVPEDIIELAADYRKTLRQRQTKQEAENTLRAELIEAMQDADIERVPIDDESYIALVDKHEVKLKVEKVKGSTE